MYSRICCALSVRLSLISALVLLSTLNSSVKCCWGSTSTKLGDITPDQKLLSGSALIIDCSLNNKTVEYENVIYHVHSNMIAFKFNKKFYRNDRIRIINETVARLEVTNASEADNGMYYCLLNVSQLGEHHPFVCLTHITVGYKPQNVSNFKCISLHYRKLHCSWTPPKNPIATSYHLEDKYHASIELWRKCGNTPSENSCEWTVDTVPPYRNTALQFNLVLTGTNQFGENSQMFVIDHYSIIKPNIPKQFRAMNVLKTSIGLSWSPPEYIEFDEELLEHIIYEIRYFSQTSNLKEKSQTVIIDGIRQTSLNLTDLIPFLNYNISIRCKTIESKSDEYWSEFYSILIQTKVDVPYLAPELTSQSFQTDKNMEGSRSITLFWKEIPLEYRNGPDFHYLIKYEFGRKRKLRSINMIDISDKTENTTYTFNHMKSEIAYHFVIYGVNSKGISSNYSQITVEKNEVIPHKPSNIEVYSYGGGRYEVKWLEPRTNPMSGPIVNYTVFWCQNLQPRPFLCQGAINWLMTRNTSITLELADIRTINYQFAVSANAMKASSGMSWAECIVPIDGRLDKLREVQLKVHNSTTIAVNWKFVCPAQKQLVDGYKINYCAVEGHTCEHSCETTESNWVDTNSADTFILSDLKPFTLYRITVVAISGAYASGNPSEESDPRCERTLHSSPEDSPSDVNIINKTSNSIELIWSPPIKPNGHIIHYIIECNERKYSQSSDKCNETHCFYRINDLESYHFYQIRVSACNSDSLCSPPSQLLSTYTSIDIPSIMSPPISEIINSTTARISWSKPLPPNGPIDAYLLKLIRNDNTTDIFRIGGNLSNEYFLTIDCDSIEDNSITLSRPQYSVQISSVNVLESGDNLIAEYSKSTSLNACLISSPPNYTYIIGLVAGTAFGLLILVIILLFLVRWMKKIIKNMTILDIELPKNLENPVFPLCSDSTEGQHFDPFARNDSFTNIRPAFGDDLSIDKMRHPSGLSQTSNESTEILYKTNKFKDNFNRLTSNESGQHESISSEAHISSDSGTENDMNGQNLELKEMSTTNKVNSNSVLPVVDETNSDSSDSKDSGYEVNSKGIRSKKPTKRKPKISIIVKPSDKNEVTNPLYDTPMSHSVCIYSLLANSEPSLFDIPVKEDDNILSDVTKFSKPEMAKSLTNIIQNYSTSEPKVNCIICETNNSSRCSTRTASPNCPYYKYGIKRQNHIQNSFVTNFSPEKRKIDKMKANNGYITIDSILQNGQTLVSSKKPLQHDWSQTSYDAEVSSTSSNGDNEQTDVLLAQNNSFSKSCQNFNEKIQNKIQNNSSFEDNTEIDSSLHPLNTSLNNLVIEVSPKSHSNSIKVSNNINNINNTNRTTTPVKSSPTHLAKDNNGYVLHNALTKLNSVCNQNKPKLTKNANGYVVLEALNNAIQMTDYVPNDKLVNHVTQV